MNWLRASAIIALATIVLALTGAIIDLRRHNG